jgi:hydrogenase expression/formation protein HypE
MEFKTHTIKLTKEVYSTVPRIPEGKVPWDRIAKAVQGRLPPEVVLGPAHGEDAALVKLGDKLWAVATDPISFSEVGAGHLAVLVNANDVAVRGATPQFFLAVVLFSAEHTSPSDVEGLLTEIRETCEKLEITLIGGHTEVTPGLRQNLVIGTMLGPVMDRAITTGGLRDGDWIGMTKWAGLEGTSILLSLLGERLQLIDGSKRLRSMREIFPGEWLSVVPEAEIAARLSAVSALHDVTEGGVGEALFELGTASGLVLDINAEAIPVLAETRALCAPLQMNPLGLIGSGALLIGCGEEGKDTLAAAYADNSIPFVWLGRARASSQQSVFPIARFEQDELLKAYVLEGIKAFVFDMDGTLIDSAYDWQDIRRQLSVGTGSIIESLNALNSPQREQKWALLKRIERDATQQAQAKPGATELLRFLKHRGIQTALVTNNSMENTQILLDRFELVFDVVLTRDFGMWKPSGAPLIEAAHRLHVLPEHCIAVGDSHYDIQAAREARYRRVCLVNIPVEARRRAADITFPTIDAFLTFLHLVL